MSSDKEEGELESGEEEEASAMDFHPPFAEQSKAISHRSVEEEDPPLLSRHSIDMEISPDGSPAAKFSDSYVLIVDEPLDESQIIYDSGAYQRPSASNQLDSFYPSIEREARMYPALEQHHHHEMPAIEVLPPPAPPMKIQPKFAPEFLQYMHDMLLDNLSNESPSSSSSEGEAEPKELDDLRRKLSHHNKELHDELSKRERIVKDLETSQLMINHHYDRMNDIMRSIGDASRKDVRHTRRILSRTKSEGRKSRRKLRGKFEDRVAAMLDEMSTMTEVVQQPTFDGPPVAASELPRRMMMPALTNAQQKMMPPPVLEMDDSVIEDSGVEFVPAMDDSSFLFNETPQRNVGRRVNVDHAFAQQCLEGLMRAKYGIEPLSSSKRRGKKKAARSSGFQPPKPSSRRPMAEAAFPFQESNNSGPRRPMAEAAFPFQEAVNSGSWRPNVESAFPFPESNNFRYQPDARHTNAESTVHEARSSRSNSYLNAEAVIQDQETATPSRQTRPKKSESAVRVQEAMKSNARPGNEEVTSKVQAAVSFGKKPSMDALDLEKEEALRRKLLEQMQKKKIPDVLDKQNTDEDMEMSQAGTLEDDVFEAVITESTISVSDDAPAVDVTTVADETVLDIKPIIVPTMDDINKLKAEFKLALSKRRKGGKKLNSNKSSPFKSPVMKNIAAEIPINVPTPVKSTMLPMDKENVKSPARSQMKNPAKSQMKRPAPYENTFATKKPRSMSPPKPMNEFEKRQHDLLFDSPLTAIRSFVLGPEYPIKESIEHLRHRNDPEIELCYFELFGTCIDDECPYQHQRDSTLNDHQLLEEILGYIPERKTRQESLSQQAQKLLESNSLEEIIAKLREETSNIDFINLAVESIV